MPKILKGGSRNFQVNASGVNPSATTWAVADTAVAFLNAGNPVQPLYFTSVQGLAVGSTTLTATNDTVTASIDIEVVAAPDSVQVPATQTLVMGNVGGWKDRPLVDGLTVNQNGTTYTSSDPTVATVARSPVGGCKVTPVAPGSCTITSTNLGVSATTVITVVPLPTLTINPQ